MIGGGSGDFLQELRARARSARRRLVFPEGTERRVHDSLHDALSSQLYQPILLGPTKTVRDGLRSAGIDPERVEILDSESLDRVERAREGVPRRGQVASLPPQAAACLEQLGDRRRRWVHGLTLPTRSGHRSPRGEVEFGHELVC